MGSLNFDCPLCCNETFNSQQSLRYHLLSIIDNLRCSVCTKRYDSIYDLAKHLDGECKVKPPNSNKFIEEVNIKVELEDSESNDTIGNSILAKALLSPNKKGTNKSTDDDDDNNDNGNDNSEPIHDTETVEGIEVEDPTADENDQDVYSCSSCGVSFTSIEEHIQKYHQGQEVVVETDRENEEIEENLQFIDADGQILRDIPEGATLITEDGVLLNNLVAIEEDSNDADGNRKIFPQMLNTIKQEECVDKDGRIYTRKVVQIEKFWDDQTKPTRKSKRLKRSQPTVLKYALDEEGTLIKAEDLPENLEDHEVVEMYQCDQCDVQFTKIEDFESHNCEPDEFECTICHSSFTSAARLSAHMRIHKNKSSQHAQSSQGDVSQGGPFVCQICDTVFPTNKSLRLHRRMHEPVKTKDVDAPVDYGLIVGEECDDRTTIIVKQRDTFTCTVCGKEYDKEYEQIHMAYHEGVNYYDCQICNRKFYTQENLKMHMRVHGANDDLQKNMPTCPTCKRTFDAEEYLEEHLKSDACTNARPYECSFCSRRFARPHEKVKHERIHTGEKPHECQICGKTFRVSYCLTLHMRTHSGHRPYACDQCGKRFKAHSVYNHHLLTHSEIRAYRCPYCPKAFKTGVQLAGHKNSHTKPFSCTECNRPFASLYAVRAHMETHKRDNNLKHRCYLCGASYARAFALRDHIKEQHANVTEERPSLDHVIVQSENTQEVSNEDLDATEAILQDGDDVTMIALDGIAIEEAVE